jgi:D-alanyl-D-alanine carboxypeptidase
VNTFLTKAFLYLNILVLMTNSITANDSLTLVDQSVGSAPVPWIVFKEDVVLRDQPSSEGAVLVPLPKDTELGGDYMVHNGTDEEWLKTEFNGKNGFVTRTALHRIHPDNAEQEGNLDYGTEMVNRWWGIPLEYEADDLVEIPEEFTRKSRWGFRLREEARDALVEMLSAAREDGVEIIVTSAYRSGPTQLRIYSRNVSRNRAQRSSAPPGHSEHQLGTTVDLTDPEAKYSFTQEFGNQPQGQWLEKNAARFGFYRSYYPDNVDQTGYISEPWHWRYMGMEDDAADAAAAMSRPTSKPTN